VRVLCDHEFDENDAPEKGEFNGCRECHSWSPRRPYVTERALRAVRGRLMVVGSVMCGVKHPFRKVCFTVKHALHRHFNASARGQQEPIRIPAVQHGSTQR
jgi:hypothetical protein